MARKKSTHATDIAFNDTDDPLTRAMAPPHNETESERAERLRAEAEAKRVSDMIDEELNRQRIAEKKGPKPVKMLLLGERRLTTESSWPDLQLMNSPKAFREERLSWRAVVQLNIVRSIRLILDAIQDAHTTQTSSVPPSPSSTSSPPPSYPRMTKEHLDLRTRLLPVLQTEEILIRRLLPAATASGAGLREIENSQASLFSHSSSDLGSGGRDAVETGSTGSGKQAQDQPQQQKPSSVSSATGRPPASGTKEVSVFAGSAWKTAFSKMLSKVGSSDKGIGEDGIDWDDPNDPTRVMNTCGPDMIKLWANADIRQLLRAQKLRLEEMPGFFLDSLERITNLQYLPSDDDILKARLKTLGVTEYRFTMKAGHAISHHWRVYDVGGQRSLVRDCCIPAWVPFFDDMNAIIFLAPISCFDQVLMEDHSVNRLEDSVLLWKNIVSNQLLAKTNLVLFLNKCDVLRAKLQSGIQLGKYVISYGDRPNDFQHASDYLRRKFYNIHQENSPHPRSFYCHFTSVTDTRTTSVILENGTSHPLCMIYVLVVN
ncbi:G-alpha-domain-containing protein [Schizopora paradoxa]|uniref:G-alpha-domain-containing protein n=1 Tax=Schizopora paradoxa TaxID=27342 RepID=A0A0H2RFE8_9AGAM|nr:G-alpha-domain-containing protein [Schizopora paradoxa]